MSKQWPMVPEVQQSTMGALLQSQREMKHHPTFPAMLEVQQSTITVSIQSHGELQHAQLVDKSPIGDLQDVGNSHSDLPPYRTCLVDGQLSSCRFPR